MKSTITKTDKNVRLEKEEIQIQHPLKQVKVVEIFCRGTKRFTLQKKHYLSLFLY
jgi:hypothetical protein